LGLGTALLGEAYRPQQELLATVQPSIDLADIGGAGQRQLAQLQAALIEAGLQSQIGAETAAAGQRQQQIQAISNLIAGNREDGTKGLIDAILNRTTNAGTPTVMADGSTVVIG